MILVCYQEISEGLVIVVKVDYNSDINNKFIWAYCCAGLNMESKNTLNQLATELFNALPDKMKIVSADAKKRVLHGLQSGMQKMDLVTREEFDIQTKMLARTREKLVALEKQVAELEKIADTLS